MTILILFHDSGFRCLKHYYLDYVKVHMQKEFSKTVSYNHFVELQKKVIGPL
jgi:2-polyprenyl-3-methyl-5-hydroxy-6-metoxy-1,4-benzoquinol methylase